MTSQTGINKWKFIHRSPRAAGPHKRPGTRMDFSLMFLQSQFEIVGHVFRILNLKVPTVMRKDFLNKICGYSFLNITLRTSGSPL